MATSAPYSEKAPWCYLVNGPIAQQEHTVKDTLDNIRRALQSFEGHNVLLSDTVEGRKGLIQGWLCSTEVFLSIILDSSDLGCLLGDLLYNDGNLLLLCRS